MPSFDIFKNKMATDEAARTSFVADVFKALDKQGVDTKDVAVMKKFGFNPAKLGDIKNVASSAIITIVM